MSRRVQRRQLVASLLGVSLLYVLLAGWFSLRTPAWENNDETAHLLYAEAVYSGQLPPIDPAHGVESHQAPLYYTVVAGVQHALGIPAFSPRVPRATEQSRPGSERVHQVSHTYDASQAQQARWLHELRFVSVLLGLVTVCAAFCLAWVGTQSVATAAAVGATVATWPKFLVVSAALTNSALVETLCAVSLLAAALWLRTQSRRWAVATGAAVGLAALTQTTAIPLGVLLLAALGVWSWRRGDRMAPLLSVTAALGCCGWWYLRNAAVYGDLLAADATRRNMVSVFGDALVRPHPGLSGGVLTSSASQVSRSVWFNAGWNQIHLPVLVDVLLCVAALVALVAGVHRLAGSVTDRWLRAVLAVGVVGSLAAWLVIAAQTTQAQGRYLLIGVPVWSLLLVLGTGRLLRNARLGRWVWPAAFLAVDAYVIATYLTPYGGL